MALHLEVQHKSCSSEQRDQDSHSEACFRTSMSVGQLQLLKPKQRRLMAAGTPVHSRDALSLWFSLDLSLPRASHPFPMPVFLQFVLICWVLPRKWGRATAEGDASPYLAVSQMWAADSWASIGHSAMTDHIFPSLLLLEQQDALSLTATLQSCLNLHKLSGKARSV